MTELTNEEYARVIRTIFEKIDTLKREPQSPEVMESISVYEKIIEKLNASRPKHPKDQWDGSINDLYAVGENKPVGYVVEDEIIKGGSSIDKIKEWAKDHQLLCQVFPNGTKGHTSAPVYIYHKTALQKLLDDNLELLESNNWPSLADEFIYKIATEDAKLGTPLHKLIAKTFADEELM